MALSSGVTMSVRGRCIGFKIFIAVVVALLVVLAVLGIYTYTMVNSYNSLQMSYTELSNKLSSLEKDYENLNKLYMDLRNNYTSLMDRYISLNNSYNRLRDDYSSLLNNYSSLKSLYSDLENRYNSLYNNYTALESKYRNLLSIVNLRASKTLDRDKPIQIPANSYTTLVYSLEYAGYIEITFQATEDIYFYVGNGDYWVRYPTNCITYADSGRFIVPVLPGTTYIKIYNPSLLFGVSITITVVYVY